MKIGDFRVEPVIDGTSRVLLDDVVARDVPIAWDCPAHPVDAEGYITLDIGGYLVKSRDRTILIDTGVGPVEKHDVRAGGLPDNLRRLGINFSDVTDVIFTHLHYDHVGWATQKGDVMFPRATYRVHAADWEYFVTGPQALPGAVRKLSPLVGQLETFGRDGEILPGIAARHSPGHSPGSTVIVIADGGDRAMVLGDVAHVIPELTDDAWRCCYDMDPELARTVRNQVTADAAADGCWVSASHFPGLRFGWLANVNGRRVYEAA